MEMVVVDSYKKSILRISLDCLKCYKSVLTVCPREGLPNYIKTN